MPPPPRQGSPRPGGYRPEDLCAGDPYEISGGELVECLPSGPRHGRANLDGGAVLSSDPAVQSAGVDIGFAPDASTLRAPDVSVGGFEDKPGWVAGAPPLAVEYADEGQKEPDLRRKIQELLGAGTRFVWVVRLTGPRRIEVHQPGQPLTMKYPGDELTAPGVLQNPVPVAAMFDREAAHEATLRNLLNRHGYKSLEHVEAQNRSEGWSQGLEQGREQGRALAVLAVLDARGLATSEAERSRVSGELDAAVLDRWLARVATVATVADLLAD